MVPFKKKQAVNIKYKWDNENDSASFDTHLTKAMICLLNY